jgi:hypothetical protein
MAVVDDLVPHIDWGTEFFERALDDLDGSLHAGAKTPRLRQDDLHSCLNPLADPQLGSRGTALTCSPRCRKFATLPDHLTCADAMRRTNHHFTATTSL